MKPRIKKVLPHVTVKNDLTYTSDYDLVHLTSIIPKVLRKYQLFSGCMVVVTSVVIRKGPKNLRPT